MFGHVVQVLGPVWSARLISLTTIFVETFADMFAFGRKIGHSTVHWLSGSSRLWLFMRENVGPLPSSAVANYETNSNVSWRFDLSNMTLHYVDETYESNENEVIDIRSLPWLSAKVIYNRGEYEIDDFGANFRFIAPRSVNPTPKLILSCWSIWSGIWLLPGQNARFEIINNDGEGETFFIHSRPSAEVERWCDVFEVEEEGDDESNGEEDEENSDTDDENSDKSNNDSDAGDEGNNDADDENSDNDADDEGDNDADNENSDDTDELNISDNSGDSAIDEVSERHSSPEIVEGMKED